MSEPIASPSMSPKTPRLCCVVALVAGLLLSHSGVSSFNTSPRLSATRHQCSFSLKLNELTTSQRYNGRRWTPSQLASNFYDDFEDFEDFGEIGDSSSSSNSSGDDNKKKKQDGLSSSSSSALGSGDNFGSGSNDSSSSDDDAVMKSLRDRMNEMSSADDFADFDEEDDEEVDDDDEEGSGSALPDLEGNTLSSIDDLIGFAQAKARQKAADDVKKGKKKKAFATGTWEDENWANPIPHIDESTGELLDLDDILERGVVLLANPAKFCSDLAESEDKSKSKGNSFMGGLFDDPFPTFGDSDPSSSSISPALLAKLKVKIMNSFKILIIPRQLTTFLVDLSFSKSCLVKLVPNSIEPPTQKNLS